MNNLKGCRGVYFSLPFPPGEGMRNSLYNFPLNLIKFKTYYYDFLFTPFLRYGLNIEYMLNIDIVLVGLKPLTPLK